VVAAAVTLGAIPALFALYLLGVANGSGFAFCAFCVVSGAALGAWAVSSMYRVARYARECRLTGQLPQMGPWYIVPLFGSLKLLTFGAMLLSTPSPFTPSEAREVTRLIGKNPGVLWQALTR
jgi:hypothetical protein